MIVLADEERFKQVIRNLLSNAVKFSPQDGTIHVGAPPHRQDRPDQCPR